jgi:hypothetical protein
MTSASCPIGHRPLMPPTSAVPTELRQTAFRGSTALRSGLLTPRQLRGSSWRRLLPDVYVHRDVPVTHELRAEAATIRLPEAVVTGCSAAVLWGVDLVGPSDDVEVTVPPAHGPVRIPGLRVRRAHLAARDRWHRCGLPVTTAAATAVRVAALLPQDDAVVAMDQLLATGVIDLEPLRAYVSAARGPGSARARIVAALADGLAESPQETRLRLIIGRSSLPPPVAQHRVLVDGRFVARVDFAWPDLKLAVEYDGLWHAEPGQFARDRRRLNLLREAGWRVVFVTAADMHWPNQVVIRIATALSS